GRLEAIIDRVIRQLPRREWNGPLAVLDAREALLFGRRDDVAIVNEARGRIVISSIDAERVHRDRLGYALARGATERSRLIFGSASSVARTGSNVESIRPRTASAISAGATCAKQSW